MQTFPLRKNRSASFPFSIKSLRLLPGFFTVGAGLITYTLSLSRCFLIGCDQLLSKTVLQKMRITKRLIRSTFISPFPWPDIAVLSERCLLLIHVEIMENNCYFKHVYCTNIVLRIKRNIYTYILWLKARIYAWVSKKKNRYFRTCEQAMVKTFPAYKFWSYLNIHLSLRLFLFW